MLKLNLPISPFVEQATVLFPVMHETGPTLGRVAVVLPARKERATPDTLFPGSGWKKGSGHAEHELPEYIQQEC